MLELCKDFVRVLGAAAAAERKRTKHIMLFIGEGMPLEHEVDAGRCFLGRNTELLLHERT